MLNPHEITLKIGSHIGKYRLLEELGEGPISHVFQADDTILYRQVALKILKPEFAREPAGETTEEEMNSAAVLLHSGIVPLYGTGAGGGYHYFSMALMPGGNLRYAMEQGISPRQALTVVSQVARALAFAHAKGINHQAIKPENILFRKDGSAVLSDFHVVKVHGFGIGALAQEPEPHPHYISPEQIQQTGKQFGRADLYSLGIVLYEMLTGEVPFRGDNAPWQHIHSPVPKLPSHLSEYQGIIDQLLAKKPSDRFVDVNQLIKSIDQLESRRPSERGGNIAIFPPGGKGRFVEGTQGDRPFIEGRLQNPVYEEKRAEGSGRNPEGGSNSLAAISQDFPDEIQSLRLEPAPFSPSRPEPEKIHERGSIGDLILDPPKQPPSARPATHPNVARMRRRKVNRRRGLVVGSLVALLAASAFIWWKVESPMGFFTLPSGSPSPRTEELSPTAAPPDGLQARFSQAVAYSRSGRPEEAAVLFRNLAEQFPQLPEPYNNLAVLYAARGDLVASQQLLEDALRVNPSYAVILENLNTIQLENALGGEYRGEKSTPRLQLLSDLHTSAPSAAATPTAAPASLPSPVAAPPVSPAPSVTATVAGGGKKEISGEAAAMLLEWSRAWAERDYPRYLTFYGKGFRPPEKQSRSAWEKFRYASVTSPAWIEVSLSELNVTPSGPDRLRVVALQEYRSDRYRDRTLKAFELGREEGGWVILSEESLGKLH